MILLLSDKRNFMGRHASYFYRTAEFIIIESLLQQSNWWKIADEPNMAFNRGRGLAFHFKTLYPRNYWAGEGGIELEIERIKTNPSLSYLIKE